MPVVLYYRPDKMFLNEQLDLMRKSFIYSSKCITYLDWRNLYMIKVQAENIKNKNKVKSILDSLKHINKYIDTLDEDDSRYEYLCEKVEEVYLEIDEALIGYEEFSEENIANATIRIMIYWDYI